MAIYDDNIDLFVKLVEYGANFRIVNDKFDLPILLAAYFKYEKLTYVIAETYKEHGIGDDEIDYIVWSMRNFGEDDMANKVYNIFYFSKK